MITTVRLLEGDMTAIILSIPDEWLSNEDHFPPCLSLVYMREVLHKLLFISFFIVSSCVADESQKSPTFIIFHINFIAVFVSDEWKRLAQT
jgi:hypothetical protein